MHWIQCDGPEHWVGRSRSGRFLWVDSIGNKCILNPLCASSLLWTEIGSLQNVFSELCLQSHEQRSAGCIPLLSSSEPRPCRSDILLLPMLASCVPWTLYLLCLLEKSHIFTTDGTPEPIKLRCRELFSPLLHALLPAEWPAEASVSCWPRSSSQDRLATHPEPGSGPSPPGFNYCCFQQTLK